MNIKEFIQKYNIKCFCGKPAVEIDSRFNQYTPCEQHRHMSPVLFQKAADAYSKRRC